MKKILIITIVLVSSFISWGAELPTGYYSGASGKKGVALQAALHDIIDGHTVVSYNGLHSAYVDTDNKGDGKVWDIYSDNPDGAEPYEYTLGSKKCGNYAGEGDCYNREHTFPQSWFSKSSPMVSDLFQVLPTDGYVNGRRSSFPYGEVDNPSWTSLNGSKLGPNTTSGYSGTVFEPLDEYKGDLARIYFYMATRYYGEDNSWPGSAMVDGAEPKAWAISLLMKWHVQDPVSTKETNRNDAAFDYQKNRNPFVDFPEFACMIWSNGDCDSVVIDPGTPTPVDSTADVDISMSSSDFQLIVDYVTANLTNTHDYSDNSENYYGASAHYTNFDGRADAFNSKFASSDEAITEALRDVFLPAKIASSLLNVDYVISYSTYDGAAATGEKTFHCSATSPLAFTLGAATVEPVDSTPSDTTGTVIPVDTTVVDPGTPLASLDLTFDTDLSPCVMVQVSGTTGWNQTAYNDNGYAVVNTHGNGANEAWLVSPAVDMDALSNGKLSFEVTSYNFGKSIADCGAGQFELYYSSSFDGSTITASEWTRLPSVDNVILGEKAWAWVTADVDVAAVTGPSVYYAFAHKSDATNGTTWEVDNVKLSGDQLAGLKNTPMAKITLSPNPTREGISVNVQADYLQILDISGHLVLDVRNVAAQEQINVSSLASGIYFVRVSVGEESEIVRLIKQ